MPMLRMETIKQPMPSGLFQRTFLMHRQMPGLVAFDFVLRFVFGGLAMAPHELDVAGVDLGDFAIDVAHFGIPGHVVADFEGVSHVWLRDCEWIKFVSTTQSI